MHMETIKSSTVLRAVGYDENTKTLRVAFQNGAVYDYMDVTEIDYIMFKVHDRAETGSVMSFYTNNIRSKYAYERIQHGHRQLEIN